MVTANVMDIDQFFHDLTAGTPSAPEQRSLTPQKLAALCQLQALTQFHLFHLSSYIHLYPLIFHLSTIYSFLVCLFFFVFMSVPCLPSSPGKPTLSTVNGNYLRQPVYQNQWPVECLTVWLCHWVFNYCYHFVSILLYFLITICSEVTVKGSDKVPNFTSMKHELFCATQGLFFLVDSGEVQFPWQLIAFLELHKVSKRQENIFLPSLVHTCMVFTQVHFTGRYLVFFNRESAKVSKYILRVKWGNAVLFNVYSMNVLCIFIFLSKNAKEYLVNL